MKTHADFSDALADFRDKGGCIRFDTIDRVWITAQDADQCGIDTEHNPRDAAGHALQAGGMTSDEIASELRDWVDA